MDPWRREPSGVSAQVLTGPPPVLFPTLRPPLPAIPRAGQAHHVVETLRAAGRALNALVQQEPTMKPFTE